MKAKSICIALFLTMIFNLGFAYAAIQKSVVADTGYRALAPVNSTYFPNTQISAIKENDIYTINSTGAIQPAARADFSNNLLNGLASYDNYFLFSYSGSFPRGIGNVSPNSSPSIITSGGFDSITGMRTAPSDYGGFGDDIFLSEAGNPDVVRADGGAVVGIVRTTASGDKSQFYDGRNAAIKLYRAMDLAFSPQTFGSYGNRIFVIDSNIQHPTIDNHRILTIASDKTAEVFMDLNDIGYITDFGSIDFHPTTGDLFVADSNNIYRIDAGKNVYLYDSGYSRIIDMRFNREGALFVSDMEASQTYRISEHSSCLFEVDPTYHGFPSEGGSFAVDVKANSASCSWSASDTADWISLSRSTGSGTGSVTIYVNEYNGTNSRSGKINIAGHTVTVHQEGPGSKVNTAWMPLLLGRETVVSDVSLAPIYREDDVAELSLVSLVDENQKSDLETINVPKSKGSLIFMVDDDGNMGGLGLTYGDGQGTEIDANSTAAGLVMLSSSAWQEKEIAFKQREQEILSAPSFGRLSSLVGAKIQNAPLALMDDANIVAAIFDILNEIDGVSPNQVLENFMSLDHAVKRTMDEIPGALAANQVSLKVTNGEYIPYGLWATDADNVHHQEWPDTIDGRSETWRWSWDFIDSEPTEVRLNNFDNSRLCVHRFWPTDNYFDTFMTITNPAFSGVIISSYETLSGNLDNLGEDEKLYRMAELHGLMAYQAALMLNIAKSIPGAEWVGSIGSEIVDEIKKGTFKTTALSLPSINQDSIVNGLGVFYEWYIDSLDRPHKLAKVVMGDGRATKAVKATAKHIGKLLNAPTYITDVKFVLDTINAPRGYCLKVVNGVQSQYDPFNPTCDLFHLNLCKTENDCHAAWGNWYNNQCNNTPQTSSCDSNHLNLCNTEGSCLIAEGYWYNNQCNSAPNPETCSMTSLQYCYSTAECEAVGGYWYNAQCNSTPNPVTTINTIPVGSGPHGIAIDPNGNYVYVANRFSDTVSVIDTASQSVVKTIGVQDGPWGITVSPQGDYVYVGCYYGYSIIRTSDNKLISQIRTEIPYNRIRDLVTSTDGDSLFFAPGAYAISIYQTTDNTFEKVINIGGSSIPQSLIVSHSGNQIYSTVMDGRLIEIGINERTIMNTITVGGNPLWVQQSLDGESVYIGNTADRSVSVVSTSQNEVTKTIPIGGTSIGGAIGPEGKYIYVSNASDDTILVIRISDNTVIEKIIVGDEPNKMIVTPDNKSLYVANNKSNTVSVINLTDAAVDEEGTVVSAGQVWMDSNLGASRVATSMTDSAAYGDLYQWGRYRDGHEKRDSGTTSELNVNSDTPGHDDFITTSSSPYDWRSPQKNELWQGGSGINNPCPPGFRLPTATEWETERLSWSSDDRDGAWRSPLNLVVAGYRSHYDGNVYNAGSDGHYCTSTVDGTSSRRLIFHSFYAGMGSTSRAHGASVRCLED